MIRTLSAGLMFIVGLGSGIAHAAEGISLNPQYNPALFKAKDPTVDPDNSIYGIKFGATEKQLLDAFGMPNGVLVLSDTKKAYLYGKTHIFILRNGKLREVKVGDHIIDWDVSQQMDGHPFFDSGKWSIKPGITNGMSFDDMKKTLNKPTAMPDYRYSFDTNNSSVILNFSGYGGGPGRSEGYRLSGFTIKNFGQ